MNPNANYTKPYPTEDEMNDTRQWVVENFCSDCRRLPFSFVYSGKSSSDVLTGWEHAEHIEDLDSYRTQRTHVYTDPNTGLEMQIVLIEYKVYPTIEWTIHFKNTGSTDIPILENILALDTSICRDKHSEFVLNHNIGTPMSADDYRPIATTLEPDSVQHIGSTGGRPMNTDMPYFNLQWSDRGMIIALGWTGQWKSGFFRDSDENLRIIGGQEQIHIVLHPGESIRTSLVVIQFWKGGDIVRSQNIWRRWMIAHNLPRQNGKLLPPIFSAAAADLFPNLVDSVSDEITLFDGYIREGLDIDYWWRDAGWYPCGDCWNRTGTWEPDPERYPNGLRELADHVHTHGIKFIVWFEPERTVPGSWLSDNHPEFILQQEYDGLVNLGNPKAWKWVVDTIDELITQEHIDMYRQDFNMDPLDCWKSNDTDDRQGFTEIKHIEGLYAFWDELKRRHPDMPFDNCAGGGRRNDIEMMRRGIPISKTDYAGGTTSSQCQLYGAASWLPYFGAGTMSLDLYIMRSNIAPWTAVCWNMRDRDLPYQTFRQFISEWKRISKYYMGDFYPLTPYSLEEDVWMAWQFDVPEKGEGMLQVFRRPENQDLHMTYRLRGLESDTTYCLTDLDGDRQCKITGRELMEDGLSVTIKQTPWAKIIMYSKSHCQDS